MTREEQILKWAQEHFQKTHPKLCVRTNDDGILERDDYYLDYPGRSDTMTAYITAAKKADANPDLSSGLVPIDILQVHLHKNFKLESMLKVAEDALEYFTTEFARDNQDYRKESFAILAQIKEMRGDT